MVRAHLTGCLWEKVAPSSPGRYHKLSDSPPPRAAIRQMVSSMASVVSAGVSWSLFAGLATGFLYLLIAGLRWARDQNRKTRIWLFKDVRNRFQSTVAAIHKSGRNETDIRDAIERFLEGQIGTSLDDAQVTKISNHPPYEAFIQKYEGALSLTLSRLTASFRLAAEDVVSGAAATPDKILSQLKKMVKEICLEAEKVSSFHIIHYDHCIDELAAKSYEDILSMAVINKVITNCNRPLPNNRSVLTEYENEVEVDETDRHSVSSSSEWNESEEDSEGATSPKEWNDYEERVESKSDWEENDSDKDDLMALKVFFNIRTAFPEFGKDIVEKQERKNCYERSLDVTSWEENWLFRKKKLKQKINCSVSMLVPSPNEPAKVFIGETDAEETSDFSDCSESELHNLIHSNDEDNTSISSSIIADIRTVPADTKARIHEEKTRKRALDADVLEEKVLRGSLTQLAYRPKQGSHQFTVNPLFHDDSCYTPTLDTEQHFTSLQLPKNKQKTHRLVIVPPKNELFTSTLSSLKDIRRDK